jgi:hypothetical protein
MLSGVLGWKVRSPAWKSELCLDFITAKYLQRALTLTDIEMPVGFRSLQAINLKDRTQCLNLIFPPLRHSKSAVDFFLSRIIFPKEMKYVH